MFDKKDYIFIILLALLVFFYITQKKYEKFSGETGVVKSTNIQPTNIQPTNIQPTSGTVGTQINQQNSATIEYKKLKAESISKYYCDESFGNLNQYENFKSGGSWSCVTDFVNEPVKNQYLVLKKYYPYWEFSSNSTMAGTSLILYTYGGRTFVQSEDKKFMTIDPSNGNISLITSEYPPLETENKKNVYLDREKRVLYYYKGNKINYLVFRYDQVNENYYMSPSIKSTVKIELANKFVIE